jgi:hypothetical protein
VVGIEQSRAEQSRGEQKEWNREEGMEQMRIGEKSI